MLSTLVSIVLLLLSVFLILLVLIQRGRGGGLAGALGGMGGQSAFGTKAGDLFTRITIVAAFVWILVCIAAYKLHSSSGGKISIMGPQATEPAADGMSGPPIGGEPAADMPLPGDSPSATPPATDSTPAPDSTPAAGTTPPADSAPSDETPQ